MKICPNCQKDGQTGRFCTECGTELLSQEIVKETAKEVDVREIEVTEMETVELETTEVTTEQNEKKFKNKKKRKFRPILTFFIVFFFIVFGLIVGGYFYIGNSEIDYDVEADKSFDEQEVLNQMTQVDFDGLVMKTSIEEGVINYFIQENAEEYEDIELPFDIEIKNVALSTEDECIYIDLKGGFVKTTIRVDYSIEIDKDKLVIEFKKIALGKWGIPMPKNLILNQLELPEEIEEGIEIPELLEVKEIDFSRDAIDIELELVDEFVDEMKDIIQGSLEKERLDYVAVGGVNEETMALAELLKDIDSDEAMEQIIYKIVADKEQFTVMLGTMSQEGAEELFDLIEEEAIYINEDTFTELKDLSAKHHEEFAKPLFFTTMLNSTYSLDSNDEWEIEIYEDMIHIYSDVEGRDIKYYGVITEYDLDFKVVKYSIQYHIDDEVRLDEAFLFEIEYVAGDSLLVRDYFESESPYVTYWTKK